MALLLATARDTAPMAMLPFSTGSTGSGGTMGFSVKASFLPGGKNRDKRFLLRTFNSDKTIFLLTDVKAQHKERGETEAGENMLSTSTPKKFLCDFTYDSRMFESSIAMDLATLRNFQTFNINSLDNCIGQLPLSHIHIEVN